MSFWNTLLLPGLTIALAACGPADDKVSPSTRGAGVAVGLSRTSVAMIEGEGPDTEPATVLDAQGEPSRFSLYSAEIMVRHIQLDLPEGASCEEQEAEIVGAFCEDDKITIEGPMIIDLLNGTASPDLSEVRVPAGQYKRIDIRIDDGDPDEGLIAEGDPLDDYSMNISASFASETGPLDLELRLKFNEDVRFDVGDAGIEVSGDGAGLLAAMDPYRWFDGETLDNCLADEDLVPENGAVLVDDAEGSECSDIENDIKRKIKESGQLMQD